MKEYIIPEMEIIRYNKADVILDSNYQTNGTFNAEGNATEWVPEELI